MERDQEFVLTVVKYLVDNPDDVTVERKIDEMGVLITLKVNPADMGKIIGKEGRTAKAIRTLLRVIGAKMDARVNLKIEEPEGSTYVRPGDATASGAVSAASSDASATALDDTSTGVDNTGSAPPVVSTDTNHDDAGTDFDPLNTGSSLLADTGSRVDTVEKAPDENPTSIL